MKSALVESATEILGKVKGSQPDWFRESEEVISPYIKSRNTLYSKWLGSHDKQDLVNFRVARGRVRIMIWRVKNEWFRKKVEEAQKERFGDKKVWQCVRDLQCGSRGRKPT